MNNLSRLQGKSKKYTIGEGLPLDEQLVVEFFDIPLDNTGNIEEIEENDSPGERVRKGKILLAKLMQVPEEEVGKVSMKYLPDLMIAMNEFMGTKDDDPRTTKMKEHLEQMKAKRA